MKIKKLAAAFGVSAAAVAMSTMGAIPAQAEGMIYVCKDAGYKNCAGGSPKISDAGKQLGGDWQDAISSIANDAGVDRNVCFYEHNNYKGDHIEVYTGSAPRDLGEFGWGDRISSWKPC